MFSIGGVRARPWGSASRPGNVVSRSPFSIADRVLEEPWLLFASRGLQSNSVGALLLRFPEFWALPGSLGGWWFIPHRSGSRSPAGDRKFPNRRRRRSEERR